MHLRLPLTTLGCLLLSLACGGGSGGMNISGGEQTANLTVRLGSDSFPGYNQVVLGIEKVEASTNGTTWTQLGNVKSAVDLMSLQNGHSTAILSGAASVPAATYTQFRITWATTNYSTGNSPAFVVSNGVQSPLTMPATTVLSGNVTVTGAGTTALLMLSGQQAVQYHPAGLTPYTFQATGSAYDPSVTAHIVGQLADGTTRLGGMEVYAETLDANGLATVQRRTFTDLSGNYNLEGLPIGSTYYVVAQPGTATSSYQALASAPVSASTATSYTANLAFGNPQAPATRLTFQVVPAASATQVTWAELRKTLTVGSDTKSLIVRSQTLDTSSQDSTFLFGLFPDTYGIAAQRSTSGETPVMRVGMPVTILSGGSPTVTVNYP